MHRGNGAAYSSQSNSQESTGPFGDMDSFVDFDNMFPYSGSSSQNSSSTNLSRTTSNQPAIQPSYPYELYPQTVPPVVSRDYHVPELTSGASSSITMSPDLLDMDAQLNAMMPAYFFPEVSGGTVDPATILGANTIAPEMGVEYKYIPQPPPQFDGKRLYAGIHTQRAAYNKDLENQRRLMEQAKKNAPAPVLQSELTIDQRIDAVLNRIKPTKIVPSASSPSQTLPHIARMKKDEEEMDEDERLLASEEGKKLSSKERRQLRNKVSARAFRSRRKEYIGQLEAEVANKTSEAAELRAENTTLKSELQQLQEFTRSVLRSPAFSSFLAELEKGHATASAPTPAEPTPALVLEPQTSYHKDPNPNMLNLAHDDWALAYGPVAGAPTWATNTQVYAVTHLPQGPVNLQDLSGKAIGLKTEDFIDWRAFPPPADGFSPNFTEKTALAPVEEDYEMYDAEEEQAAYIMPDNLEDLVAAKQGNISDRIEKLAPGVGLDSLLGTLEAVVNGEVEVKEAFSSTGVLEKVDDKETLVEEDTPEYRQRCKDVARMFDVMESFKRVGDIIGRG
ncbi:hypothetical protein L211DRAFT_518666 [Terfezia boudieri ATCC MYA-4762]|uniref:BZIP domain-containing protein n=1 Tax=Terfezia boudieri ATCC MYA-4762 TaxID=1051890 RepID=A0A3N4LC31_9PEZI|nr:hypothetical protein L211DRAFT_518666 [Terfezia boudieri ATCC MYA-4762]